MPIKNFNDIRSKLPGRYASIIARKLDGISSLQVRLVFRGEITDPEKVGKVLEEAKILAVIYDQQRTILHKHKRVQSCISTKSAV